MREFYLIVLFESELILERQNKEITKLYKKSLGIRTSFQIFKIQKYKHFGKRGLLVRLIDKIYVLEDKKIEIQFNYDETLDVFDKINSYTNQYPEKIREVV